MTCVNVEIRYKISETSLRIEIYVVSRVKCADSEYQLKKGIVCLFLRVNGVDDCCREVLAAGDARIQIFPPNFDRRDGGCGGRRWRASSSSAQWDSANHSAALVADGGAPGLHAEAADGGAGNDPAAVASEDFRTRRGCAASKRSR